MRKEKKKKIYNEMNKIVISKQNNPITNGYIHTHNTISQFIFHFIQSQIKLQTEMIRNCVNKDFL
jgi:hypothetical protein